MTHCGCGEWVGSEERGAGRARPKVFPARGVNLLLRRTVQTRAGTGARTDGRRGRKPAPARFFRTAHPHAHLSSALPAAAVRALVCARPAAPAVLGAARAPHGGVSPRPRGAAGAHDPRAWAHLRQDRPGVLGAAGRGAGAVPLLAQHADGPGAGGAVRPHRARAGGGVRRAGGPGVRRVRPRAAGGRVAGAGVPRPLPRRGRGGKGAAPRRGARRGARRALRARGAALGGAVVEPSAAARPARGDRRVRAPHRGRDGLSPGGGVRPRHRREVRGQPARDRPARDRRDGAPAHAGAGVRGGDAGGPHRRAGGSWAWWTRSGWWTRWWRPTSR